METTKSPKRVVFRFHVRYELNEGDIIRQYLAAADTERDVTYFIHSIPPMLSSKAHTVLDLHHIDNPSVDLDKLPYEVFLVKKEGDFIFHKLGDDAFEKARVQCQSLEWGKC